MLRVALPFIGITITVSYRVITYTLGLAESGRGGGQTSYARSGPEPLSARPPRGHGKSEPLDGGVKTREGRWRERGGGAMLSRRDSSLDLVGLLHLLHPLLLVLHPLHPSSSSSFIYFILHAQTQLNIHLPFFLTASTLFNYYFFALERTPVEQIFSMSGYGDNSGSGGYGDDSGRKGVCCSPFPFPAPVLSSFASQSLVNSLGQCTYIPPSQ